MSFPVTRTHAAPHNKNPEPPKMSPLMNSCMEMTMLVTEAMKSIAINNICLIVL